jgi:biotin operon repressor
MDLQELLKKNKSKTDKLEVTRSRIDIADDDRPYFKTSNKVATNLNQNQQQSSNNTETNWQQTSNKKTKTSNKVASKVATLSATNQQQSSNKVATNVSFSELVGLQRNILIFIYQECQRTRSKTTESLTLEYIAESLETTPGSVRTSIQRLEAKGSLIKTAYKNGRGGWSKYELPNDIHQDIVMRETSNKVATKSKQSSNKVAAQLATEPATTPLSSSSYINKTTTTELPEEWREIDITPLEHIGFSFEHVRQLLKCSKPEIVRMSINHFAYDLEHKEHVKANKAPLNLLMGVLIKGNTWVAANYESRQDRALKQVLEAKKAEHERRASMETQLIELEFADWFAKLTHEDKANILPRGTIQLPDQAIRASCKQYFVERVYKK